MMRPTLPFLLLLLLSLLSFADDPVKDPERESLALAREAALHPKDSRIHFLWAESLLREGKEREALKQMERAWRLDGSQGERGLRYGWLLAEGGDNAGALKVFVELSRSLDRETAKAAKEAEAELRRPLEDELARVLRSLALSGDDATFHREAAAVLESLDRPREALDHYLSSWRISPEHPLILFEAARLAEALGERRLALAARQAAWFSPSLRARERALRLLQGKVPDPGRRKEILSLLGASEDPYRMVSTPSPLPLSSLNQELEREGWMRALKTAGLGTSDSRLLRILRPGDPAPSVKRLREEVKKGGLLILEGETPTAEAFGFRSQGRREEVGSGICLLNPEEEIVWAQPLSVPLFQTPSGSRTFFLRSGHSSPLTSGFALGKGAVLWSAVGPGAGGYERIPFLPSYLASLGIRSPWSSQRLWAFLDTSYRLNTSPSVLAKRWREMGVAALHIAGWHFFEREPQGDSRLREIISACHREGLGVYAWLELPHVSERFWEQTPLCREKTALLQDAKLDWRKLVNLQDPSCAETVKKGVRDLILRFDWDGVNLAELYFESLEGAASPGRFTPMNGNVRREFTALHGFDPAELFRPGSPSHGSVNPEGLRKFLEYRVELAAKLQQEWITEFEALRVEKPWLEIVLTHVDDRFDTRMRDLIGADAARLLRFTENRRVTFLVEDPATVWHLGPERYPEIADRYAPLTSHPERLAVDINVVDRFGEDLFPTVKQRGSELLGLVALASSAFPRVTLYAENTVSQGDIPFLPAAASGGVSLKKIPEGLEATLLRPAKLLFPGPLLLDGRPWPLTDGSTVALPAGKHRLTRAATPLPYSLLGLNADIEEAEVGQGWIEVVYRNEGRVWALLPSPPERVEVEGTPWKGERIDREGGGVSLSLPEGKRRARLFFRLSPQAGQRAQTEVKRVVLR